MTDTHVTIPRAVHAFDMFDIVQYALDKLGLGEEFDPNSVAQDFGFRAKYDEKGEYIHTYLCISLRVREATGGLGKFSYYEIPIDYRIAEEWKNGIPEEERIAEEEWRSSMSPESREFYERFDTPPNRNPHEAWLYKKSLDK